MFRTKAVENIGAHISCSMIFFFYGNRCFCEVMWKGMVEPEMLQITTQYCAESIQFACWIYETRTQARS
jgi:hypothetical protein